jgi:tetratricopeptide (TPR) repeat protein
VSEPSIDAMETIAGESTGSSGIRDEGLPRGTLLGRYVVIGPAGAGSMGMVYAAIDPELDRKLALKVLRVRSGASVEPMKARLLKEAKVLAKLAHPNVVAIHDVGALDDRVWLAMEFIEGETLRKWTASRRGRWREVLDVMIAAGHGLVAAHEAGLVHRDFKPENVMVGGDRRVRVTDFGLASAPDAAIAAVSNEDDVDVAGTTVDHGLVGTPAYMAPEQLRRGPSGPAADQFAFCVTTWEAIHGERPFAGDNTHAIVTAVLDHRIRTPTDPGAMPSWLRRILVRGLALDAGARFPSMSALLHEIERSQKRRRVGRIAAGLAVVAAVPLSFVLVHAQEERREARRCAALAAEIGGVWPGEGGATEQRIRAALHDVGPNGDAIAERLTPWLDESATRWATVREDTCRAHALERRFDDDMSARADACLDSQRIGLEALLQSFEHADSQVLYRAISSAAALPSADSCGDVRDLVERPAPDRRGADVLRVLRAMEARTKNLHTAGQFEASLRLAEHQLAIATLAGPPHERVAALELVGEQLVSLARYDEAEAMLVDAYVESGRIGARRSAAAAAVALVDLVGWRRGRAGEAMVWGRAAEVAIAGVEQSPGMLDANRLQALSHTHDQSGSYAEMVATAEQSLAILESVLGPEHPRTLVQMCNLAGAQTRAGKLADAEALLERALPAAERVLAHDHPDVATCTTNLANIYMETGRELETAALYEQTLEIVERVYGPRHPNVGATVLNLALARSKADRDVEAEPLFLRGLAIYEDALGPSHPMVAITLTNYGASLMERGEWLRAKEVFGRAIAIETADGKPERPELAGTLNNLALAVAQLGDLEEGQRLLARALAILDRTVDRDHPVRATILLGIGELAEQQERYDLAIERTREALEIRERAGVGVGDVGRCRFALARSLWHRDRKQAIVAAERARTEMTDGRVSTDAVTAWLAAR